MTKALAERQNNVISSPDSFIEKAIDSGASVETLERLMALKERYDADIARRAYIAAMQQFQDMKPTITKSKDVKHGNAVVYRYATLQDIEQALKAPLKECGLFFRFECFEQEDKTGVTCIVTHEGGHSEKVSMSAPSDVSGAKNGIQGKGSTITYLQRYTLIGAFALTTADEDDDGQLAGDLPYNLIMKHNAYLRDNLDVVLAIKEAIRDNDGYAAAGYMDQIPEDVKDALWLAPTKGGIFTTAERGFFKSDDYAHARADYQAEKEERASAKTTNQQ